MFSDFTAWVTDPTSYNWITLIAAIAAFMTAIFTGYTAFLAWKDRRQRIEAEWIHKFDHEQLRVTCRVLNQTRNTLDTDRFIVSGPVSQVREIYNGRLKDKHASWSANECSAGWNEIPPDEQVSLYCVIDYDHEQLLKSSQSLKSRSLVFVTKLFYRLFSWRLPLGPKLSVRLVLRRSSSRMRPIRFKHRIRMYAEHAQKTAASIAENEAQK